MTSAPTPIGHDPHVGRTRAATGVVALRDFIVVTEVDDGPAFAEPVFRRKYAVSAPDFPHHIVAFYRRSDQHFVPVSYLHATMQDEMCLIGGGCTDGSAFALMRADERDAIAPAGGLLLQTLRYAFMRYASECEAFFGLCGDARAFAVDMQAGFQPTEHEHLLVHWHRLLSDARRAELTARARAVGPF